MSQPVAGMAFPETRWSKIIQLRARGGGPDAEARALAELCEAYWFPLYAYARRCGHAPADAEDLTQGFFRRLLEQDLFAKADPARGRLRSFLLTLFKRSMTETRREASAQRRGGTASFVSFDRVQAEDRYAAEMVETNTPETLYERSWFTSLLQQTLERLRSEYVRRGKGALFQELQDYLAWNTADERVARTAERCGLSPGALRVAILRMRQRFGELLKLTLADTTATPEELEQELERLRQVFGG